MHATLLVGGTVVEFDPPRVERTDIVIHGDRLGDVADEIPTTSTVNCTDCLIVPGLVVGHTHLYRGLTAGMPLTDVPHDAESLRASVQAAAIAAARAGVTCVIDHHRSPGFVDGSLDVVAEALDEVGLRAMLASADLRESERFVERTKKDPIVRGAIGVDSDDPDEALRKAAALAQQHDAWLLVHGGPAQHLDSFGLLGETTIMAHALDADADLLRQRKTWVAQQARSDMYYGVGFAPRISALERTVPGTDGLDHDLLREVQAAHLRAREARAPSPDPTESIARGHRLASAIFGERFGSLRTGGAGDLAVMTYDAATPFDATTLGSHLLFGFGGAQVRDLFVAGRAVMRNRRIVGLDERRVFVETRKQAQRLQSRMVSATSD